MESTSKLKEFPTNVKIIRHKNSIKKIKILYTLSNFDRKQKDEKKKVKLLFSQSYALDKINKKTFKFRELRPLCIFLCIHACVFSLSIVQSF